MAEERLSAAPGGIDAQHLHARPWHRHASPIAILLLGLVVGLGLSGFLGGRANPVRTVVADAATLRVEMPERIRNGVFLEMRLAVTARRPIDDLVVAIPASLWRELTINSMIPAPAEEEAKADAFLFSYGSLAPGETLTLKFDGQVNPALFAGTAGRIRILDGDRPLMAYDARLRVLP